MINFLTNCLVWSCFFVAYGWPAILNIICYPISKKWSVAVSEYIVHVCAHQIFEIFDTYKNFKFIGYKDKKDMLPPQFMIVSNHQSLIDIPLYMNFLRDKNLRFVAKDELSRHIPLVSEMLRAEEHCMIPRHGSPSVAMKTISDFGKRVVARNQIPVIFPEGTRSKDGNIGKFYSAGFRMLSESSQLPVVVCALDGGYRIGTMKKIAENLSNGSYRVKILGIFPPPRDKEEQIALLEKARSMVQEQLDEWRKEDNLNNKI
jgi:1-acyl-sn-glycerol-3-phosphate acyltransferase